MTDMRLDDNVKKSTKQMIGNYRDFLLPENNRTRPNLGADIAWHTHQLVGYTYRFVGDVRFVQAPAHCFNRQEIKDIISTFLDHRPDSYIVASNGNVCGIA